MDDINFPISKNRIRRLLAQVQFTVDPTSGAESADVITDQNISNTDILNQINSSLMSAYMDLTQDTPWLFMRTTSIGVAVGDPIVGLPPGTFQVQAVEWLTDVNQNPQTAQRSDWAPSYEYDEDNIADFNPSGQDVPTWRREGDTLVLSWDAVRITTPRFMRVRAIILPPTFGISQTPNTEVVGTALARVIQEFVVYDSALVLASTKNKAIPQIIVKGQADWSERLKRAAQNLNHPRFTQFRSSRMFRNTYTHRG